LLTFVCEVVSQAEDELWWRIAVLEDESLCDLALVDKPWADFEIGLAGHDLDIVFLSYGPLKLLLAFACLERSEFRIRLSVVPCKCDLLLLDEGSYSVSVQGRPSSMCRLTLCLVSESLESINDLLLPAHVLLLGQVHPLVAQRLPHETAMFGAQTKLWNVAHPLI
jgi:hypothetical protein